MSVFSCLSKSTLLCALLSCTVHAASTFPRGCEIVGFFYNQKDLILNETGNQAYYLIQNRSDSTIELERYESGDTFMSPPLHAIFTPMNWGAFASDLKELHFKCYKKTAENTAMVDCQEVLDVCQYPRARFALSNKGSYWISSNKPQNLVIQDSVKQGIYLKW